MYICYTSKIFRDIHETFEEIKDCSSLLQAFNKDKEVENSKIDEDCLDYDKISKEQTNEDISWKTWKEIVLFLLDNTKLHFQIKKKNLKRKTIKPTGYRKKQEIEQEEVNVPIKRKRSFEIIEKNEEKSEQIKENKWLFGTFDENDKPESIIRTTLYDVVNKTSPENRLFLVSWETRPGGVKPKSSFCLGEMLKEKYPLILLEFYEKNSTFI